MEEPKENKEEPKESMEAKETHKTKQPNAKEPTDRERRKAIAREKIKGMDAKDIVSIDEDEDEDEAEDEAEDEDEDEEGPIVIRKGKMRNVGRSTAAQSV